MLDIPSKERQMTASYVLHSYHKEGSTAPLDHFVFGGTHSTPVITALAPMPSDVERCQCRVGPEQERPLQQVQALGQAALLLGPHGPADSVALEVSVVGNTQSGAGGISRCELQCRLLESRSKAVLSEARNNLSLENGFGHIIGPGRDRMFDPGISNDHTFRAAHSNQTCQSDIAFHGGLTSSQHCQRQSGYYVVNYCTFLKS